MSVLAAIFLAAAYFFYVINLPRKNLDNVKAEYIMKAKELYEEFHKDERKANAKYLNKVILVTGTVSEVKRNQAKEINVILQADEIFGVSCTFDMRHNNLEQLKKLTPGVIISLKGKCTGLNMDVVLTDCILLEIKNEI